MEKLKYFGEFLNESIDRKNIEIIFGLSEEQYNSCLEYISNEISNELNGEVSPGEIKQDLDNNSDMSKSIMSINKTNNELIGCILCKQWHLSESISQYDGGEIKWNNGWDNKINDLSDNGIEGLAMSVKEKYRGSFAVYLMISELSKRGYDYIIIQQYESLKSNINYNTKKNIEIVCTVISPELPEPLKYFISKL